MGTEIVTIERVFVVLGLIAAIAEICIEFTIYSAFVSYTPDEICCGLVLQTEKNDDELLENIHGVLSPPCDILYIGQNGLNTSTDGNNYCIANGITCNVYNNGTDTLSSCLFKGGYKLSDLCSDKALTSILKEFRTNLSIFFWIAVLSIILNALLDIYELLPTKCCPVNIGNCKILPAICKKERNRMVALWLFQLFAWICNIICSFLYSDLTANGESIGYQNVDYGGEDDETVALAADYVNEHCNSDSSPIVANFGAVHTRIQLELTLSSVTSAVGLGLTVIAILFEIYHLYYHAQDKKQMEMQQEMTAKKKELPTNDDVETKSEPTERKELVRTQPVTDPYVQSQED